MGRRRQWDIALAPCQHDHLLLQWPPQLSPSTTSPSPFTSSSILLRTSKSKVEWHLQWGCLLYWIAWLDLELIPRIFYSEVILYILFPSWYLIFILVPSSCYISRLHLHIPLPAMTDPNLYSFKENNQFTLTLSLALAPVVGTVTVWPSCSDAPRCQHVSGVSSSTPRSWRAASCSSPSSGSSVSSMSCHKLRSQHSGYKGNTLNIF